MTDKTNERDPERIPSEDESASAPETAEERASAGADASGEAFVRSLDNLKASDLGPAPQKTKKGAGAILAALPWILVASALLAVAVWSGAQVVSNLVDFSSAKDNYDEIAGEFSPISKRILKPGKLEASDPLLPVEDQSALVPWLNYRPATTPTPTPTPGVTPSEDPTAVSVDPTPGDDPTPTAEPTPTPTPTPTPVYERDLDDDDPKLSRSEVLAFKDTLAEMRRSYNNNDIFGWIHIPGTTIDYPLVRGADNDFYLDHDPKKRSTGYGSIYLDCRNDTDLLNNQLSIIYGHNIRKDGTMFNRLLDYRNAKLFFNKNYRYVYIHTENAILKYEVFSAYETDASLVPNGTLTFPTNYAFMNKIREIESYSLHHLEGFEPMANDRVVLLYTCANSTYHSERWLVFGVLVGVGTA